MYRASTRQAKRLITRYLSQNDIPAIKGIKEIQTVGCAVVFGTAPFFFTAQPQWKYLSTSLSISSVLPSISRRSVLS